MTGHGSAADGSAAEILDIGAQAERTALSWERTGFGLVAVGALMLHDVHQRASPVQIAFGIGIAVVGAVISAVIGPRRYRRIIADVRGHRSPSALPHLRAVAVLLGSIALGAALVLTL